MIVKLQTGSFASYAPTSPEPTETPASLDREALLVYCGNFESMDGMVEIKEEHIVRLHDNHNTMLAQIARMVAGDVPLKYNPPLQLDHSVLAKDTIGRMVGNLRIGEHSIDGQSVKALYGNVRVLGKENVEKVMDGRWTNLSIGADLEKGKFQELTVTPFPAAPDAAMLSRMAAKTKKYKGKTISIEPGPGVSWYVKVDDIKRGPFQKEDDAWYAAEQIVESGITQQFSGGTTMFERLMKFLMRKQNLSAEQAKTRLAEGGKSFDEWASEEKKEHERMKKHLVHQKKMSEEDAEKHLSDMNVEDHKKLAAEVDEHEKKMSAEAPKDEPGHEAGKAQMAAARASLTKLSTDFRSRAAASQLSLRKAKVVSRLSSLQSQMKITPAEVKKIDLTNLSLESDATVDAVLKTYENREPVILTGMFGSKQGVDVSSAYGQVRMTRLERETRANMPFLAHASKAKLAADKESTPGTPSSGGDAPLDDHQDAPHEAVKKLEKVHEEAQKHMEKVHAAMDDGNIGKAKDHLRALMAHYAKHLTHHHMGHMGEESAHKVETEMSALAENVQKMQNDFNEIITLASSIVGNN